jgi:dTDP-4-amino-4,6-dideoxygalactose transaminase
MAILQEEEGGLVRLADAPDRQPASEGGLQRTEIRIPLVRPYFSDVDQSARDYARILESGRLTNFGPFTRRLERLAEERLETRHAIAVANATTGLMLLIDALDLEDGAEIVLPSFTFPATFMAVASSRKRFLPVFADVDPETFLLDASSVQRCLTRRTAAIVAVHAFGVPCNQHALGDLARRQGLRMVYDSAHALGSTYRGAPVGGQGDAQVFSLSATKLLPCGEGGLVLTNDPSIRKGILDRRNYGYASDASRDCANIGWNGKLTEASAALGVQEMATLDERVARRNQIAARYRESLDGIEGLSVQRVPEDLTSTYKDFVITVDPSQAGVTRDDLKSALRRNGIESDAYFWPPVHEMTVVRKDFAESTRVPLPHTERLARSVLSLPIHEHLTDQDVEAVASAIRHTCRSR